MENKRMSQQAGEGSTQLQIEKMIVNAGISQQEAKEICEEVVKSALIPLTDKALELADQRNEKLVNVLINRLYRIDSRLSFFADPEFQFLLKKAQRAAAASDREFQYAMLTELIASHVQHPDNRKEKTAISKATEIVDLLDADALCGLTVSQCIAEYKPKSGSCVQGLMEMSQVFSRLMDQELPEGPDWLEHLSILNAIRISNYGMMKKFEQYAGELLNGYDCTGLRQGTPEWEKAKELLDSTGLDPEKVLAANELLPGFCRLPVCCRNKISTLCSHGAEDNPTLRQKQMEVLSWIWSAYSADSVLKEKAHANFSQAIRSWDSLRTLADWRNRLPLVFEITDIGKALARANAERCVPGFRDLT